MEYPANSEPGDDNLEEHSSLGSGSSSQFGSEVEEIVGSTSGHSSLIEYEQSIGDEEDIYSEVPSYTQSPDSTYFSSQYISSSETMSLPEQEEDEDEEDEINDEDDEEEEEMIDEDEDEEIEEEEEEEMEETEVVSSSSSFTSVEFDSSSSSSSGSDPATLPQHKLLGSRQEQNSERSGSSRMESGSAKLRRILYGSSSSFSDEYGVLESSSDSSSTTSSSESSSYERIQDQDDIISREEEQKDSRGGIDFGNRKYTIDNYPGKSDEFNDIIPSQSNEDYFDDTMQPTILSKINEEEGEDDETFTSKDYTKNDDTAEGNVSASSIAHSDVLTEQSHVSDINRGKDTPPDHEDPMAVSIASPETSEDSNSRSLRNSKSSKSRSSQSRSIGSSTRSSKLSKSKSSRSRSNSRSISSETSDDQRSNTRSSRSSKRSKSNNSQSTRSEINKYHGSTSTSPPVIFESSLQSDESHSSSRKSKKSNTKMLPRKAEVDPDKLGVDDRSQSTHSDTNEGHGTIPKSSAAILKSPSKSDKSRSSRRSIKESSIKVLHTKPEIDSNKQDDDAIPQETLHSEIAEDDLLPKASTVWVKSEKRRDNSDEVKANEEDDAGWKPPALTTFSVSNYEKSPKPHQKEKFPRASDPAFQSKQGFKSPEKSDILKLEKAKSLKKRVPPPLLQVVVMPQPEDDSTLGTKGTYLERFPNRKKKKKTKSPEEDVPPPMSEEVNVPQDVPPPISEEVNIPKDVPPPISQVVNIPQSYDASTLETAGTFLKRIPKKKKEKLEEYTTSQRLEDSNKLKRAAIEEMQEERSLGLADIIDTTVEFGLPHEVSEIFGTVTPGMPTEYEQELPHNIEQYFPLEVEEGINDGIESEKPDRADPPGDAFVFSYNRQGEQQPLLGLYDSNRVHNFDDVENTWKSSEPSSSAGASPPRFVTPSQYPMTSWVVTSNTPREPAIIVPRVDIDPTRAFINSLIAEKRTITSDESKANYRLLRHQDDVENGKGGTYSIPLSHDVGLIDASRSEQEEIPLSESSSSKSFEVNVFPNSSSMKKAPGTSILKKSSSYVPQSISLLKSNSSADSKTPGSSDIMPPTRKLLQRKSSLASLNDPLDIEIGLNIEETKSDLSDATPSETGMMAPVRRLLRSVSKMNFRNTEESKSDDSDSNPTRRLLQRRGSAMKLNTGDGLLRRRGSVSNLDVEEDKSDDSDLKPPGRSLLRRGSAMKLNTGDGLLRRGSVSILDVEDDGSDSESSKSFDIMPPARRLPGRRGSVSFLDAGDDKSDDSDSRTPSGADLVPQRGLTRARSFLHESYAFLFASESSESSDALLPASELEKDVPEQDGRAMRIKKTIIILLCVFTILSIAIAIIIVVLWRLGTLSSPIDGEPTQAPTPFPVSKPSLPSMPPLNTPSSAPIENEGNKDLYGLIVEAFPEGQSALEDPNSPQSQALEWLESSSNEEISASQRLLQRYALATLYYATNGDGWTNNTGWLSEEDECNWKSTADSICDKSGRYTKVDLQENNLSGMLPAELGILSDTVRSVITRKNFLSGEIPSSFISNLKELQVLDLSSNKYSGILDKKLFDATSLTRLSLFENDISSSIPTEIGQLTNLGVLDLGSNMLTSTIPTTIDRLSNLAGLSLFDNMLTGTVPSELSSIQSLEMLYIDSNELEAPIPEDLCLLDIEEFWGDCERIQCTCCTMCCAEDFGCVII